MSDPIDEIAARHVAKSLEEMRDPASQERWANGERAKEQAAEIVARILADRLGTETENKTDAT